MPNYCSNELLITAHETTPENLETLKSFFKAFEEGEFLQLIKPMPEVLLNTLAPADDDAPALVDGYKDWYSWRVDNWGTKWDIMHPKIINFDTTYGELEVHFDTAWSPPISVYKQFHEKYDEFDIQVFYREDGVQLCGYFPDDAW